MTLSSTPVGSEPPIPVIPGRLPAAERITQFPPASQSATVPAGARRRGLSLVALAVTLAVGFGGGGAAVYFLRTGSADSVPTATTTSPGATYADVARLCESYLLRELVAPATARWSGVVVDNVLTFSATSEGVPMTIYLHGTVDAENAFGALVRSRWNCQVDRTGSGPWTVNPASYATLIID